MIEGIPLVGLSAPVLLGVVVLMIFRGYLLTPREARAMERRIEALEAANVLKDQTIAEFVDAISTSNALIASLHDVAKAARDTS